MTNEPMTEAEVHAFAVKTRAWWHQLTGKEQALFRQFLRSASPTGDDVEGYGYHDEYNLRLMYSLVANALTTVQNLFQPHTATAVPGTGGAVGGSFGGATLMN